ncbi:hypothetical protein ACIO6U_12280 [Streptomyces sp. NPDC087422]
MVEDVGTSCATINDTPETSFTPLRHGMDALYDSAGNKPTAIH